MDELEQEWLDSLCEQAQRDDKLSCALLVIDELHAAITERRAVNHHFEPMLRQMLAARALVRVQEIGWMAAASRPPKDEDAEPNPS